MAGVSGGFSKGLKWWFFPKGHEWSLSENMIDRDDRLTPFSCGKSISINYQWPFVGFLTPFQTDPDIAAYCAVFPETCQGPRCSAKSKKMVN